MVSALPSSLEDRCVGSYLVQSCYSDTPPSPFQLAPRLSTITNNRDWRSAPSSRQDSHNRSLSPLGWLGTPVVLSRSCCYHHQLLIEELTVDRCPLHGRSARLNLWCLGNSELNDEDSQRSFPLTIITSASHQNRLYCLVFRREMP